MKTALDKTIVAGAKDRAEEEHNRWNVDASMNKNHDDDAAKSRYLARHYPSVDERDVKTPDNWVKDTPINTVDWETSVQRGLPLPELFDYGFISPVNLHIVRNHGAVPKLGSGKRTELKSMGTSRNRTISAWMNYANPLRAVPCLVGNAREQEEGTEHD